MTLSLKSKRQQIHADIAAVLEHDFPRLVENQPEVLAFHYQEAGNHQMAIRYWFESGQRALAQSANVEAIANFRKALQLLNALPETPERTKQEIDIQLALGIPLIAVQGYAAAETREAFSRARTLCLRLGNIPEYFQALFGVWGNCWMRARNDEALRMADEFLSRSQALSDPVLLKVAHRVMGSTLLTVGDFQSSANHFEETIRLSTGKEERPLYNLYMVEPRAASLLLLSWDLWFLGYPDQSLSRVLEALALGQGSWSPLHRSVRSLHDVGRAPPAGGRRLAPWRAPKEASRCHENNGFRCMRFCPEFHEAEPSVNWGGSVRPGSK